ncbi:male-specific histamine-binding salivary protein-like [Dermacentor silvarum]|uniref:male-specific histamine-binding salivary protein-like n=1 Tax=Dermacentor silvarum TaxID=543639 RepID=UPI001896D450|nr:male-specific histamine-binding salivary protein-like [Dermacentor silvarum]XP_037561670.1 male-specific histamine-binding salivary protein-like [Dermacentor silvarum]
MKSIAAVNLGSLGILFVAVTFALAETELLERQPRLSKYQDAWKSLTVPGRYYLYMRSYEDEPFYGADRKCVFNELVSINEEEKYTVSTFGSTSTKDGTTSTQTAYAWAHASEGYTVPNVIEASNSKEKLFTLEYPVAFSEYDNCDILRVPHRGNACELWAKEGKIHQIKSLCFYVFHLLCGPEKYFVYDRDLCSREVVPCD